MPVEADAWTVIESIVIGGWRHDATVSATVAADRGVAG